VEWVTLIASGFLLLLSLGFSAEAVTVYLQLMGLAMIWDGASRGECFKAFLRPVEAGRQGECNLCAKCCTFWGFRCPLLSAKDPIGH